MQRLASGLVLGAAALAAVVFVPPQGLRLLACAVAVVAADEYLRLLIGGAWPRRLSWLTLVAATAWAMVTPTGVTALVVAALTVVGVILEVVWGRLGVRRAAQVALVLWYIGAPLGLLAGVHILGGTPATLLLLATVVISDSGQYYTGRAVGRRLLAPVTSPKKTVEGAAGGVVLAAVFFALAGEGVLPTVGRPILALLAVVLAVLGICGDLFESHLKRSARVKDSSAWIPGHGGVLDRIDALLFVTPAFYLYMRSLT